MELAPPFILHETRHWTVNHHSASARNAQTLTDGAEVTLFIWREFGKSLTPPAVQGPSISQVIERLRESFKARLVPSEAD